MLGMGSLLTIVYKEGEREAEKWGPSNRRKGKACLDNTGLRVHLKLFF